MHTSGDAVSRCHLTRVPSADAIRGYVALHDPALPDVIGGTIAAECHGNACTLFIAGAHGSHLVHITPSDSFRDASARIHAALIAVSLRAPYPGIAPSQSELATRGSRSFGS